MPWKWEYAEFKHPMARARGLGSARSGYTHWAWQRITAISNIFLVLWGMWSVTHLAGTDYAGFHNWLSQPLHAIPFALFIISVFTHAAIGLQVVLEDYMHHEGRKVLSIVAIRLLAIGLAVAGLFSIVKIAD